MEKITQPTPENSVERVPSKEEFKRAYVRALVKANYYEKKRLEIEQAYEELYFERLSIHDIDPETELFNV